MSAGTVIVIIGSGPPGKKAKQTLTPVEVHLLYIEGEAPADTLRRAIEQLEG